MTPSKKPKLGGPDYDIVRASWLVTRRGQNFTHHETPTEFRMFQRGPLSPDEGVHFEGKGLAIVFNRETQVAQVYVFDDPDGNSWFNKSDPSPKPCWTVFKVDLTGLGHIAMANRLCTALAEMQGIHRTSGMESVSDD